MGDFFSQCVLKRVELELGEVIMIKQDVTSGKGFRLVKQECSASGRPLPLGEKDRHLFYKKRKLDHILFCIWARRNLEFIHTSF